jgi:tetratricopeptide (TPR) repeat protein
MSHENDAQKIFEEGMAEFVDHQYGKSIERLSKAIELNPKFALAFKSRGAAYLRSEQADAAIADFDSVIRIDPDNARAYHLRGLAYEKAGDTEKAMRDFDKAIELKPDYGAVYYSRANLNSKLGRTDQAAEDIRMVTHLTEVNIETFSNANNVWRSQQLRFEALTNDNATMDR